MNLNLRDAIKSVDDKGYNAINFDEFVFLPTSNEESFEEVDYIKEMKFYYFFQPRPQHRVNAWKKNPEVNLVDSGGHNAFFPGIKVYPESFILRHYLCLSRNHAINKYCSRVFSREEVVMRKWHGKRATIKGCEIRMPSREQLKEYSFDRNFDRSSPWKKHYFL